MKKCKRHKLIWHWRFCMLLMSLLLCACKDTKPTEEGSFEEKDTERSDPEAETSEMFDSEMKYSNALYIYMCGSTLETRHGDGTRNIADMLSAELSPDCCVIIETGGADKWRKYGISDKQISRYMIKDGELFLLETCDQANMGSAETLADFLKFCTEYYPAERMNVVLWNHGAGSVEGVCFDENYEMDGLNLQELRAAFSACGIRFDLIGFDACLMANYETAELMSHYGKHMIASEEIEPTLGWDYSYMVSALGEENYYQGILRSYQERCEAAGKTAYTLSHIDLEQFAGIRASMEYFCSTKLNETMENALLQVVDAVEEAMSFGSSESKGETHSDLIDLKQFADNLSYPSLCREIEDAVETVNGVDRMDAGGLSFFYPVEADEDCLTQYMKLPGAVTYKKLLAKHYSEKQVEAEYIRFLDSGSNADGELKFVLSADSLPYVRGVKYKVHQLIGDDEINCLGYDSDVISDRRGMYTTDFNGKWLKINGYFASCEAIDRYEDQITFLTGAKLNGMEGDIRFTYDLLTESFTVEGFVPAEENETGGRLLSIKDKDQVELLMEKGKIGESEHIETNARFTVKNGIECSVAYLPEGNYQIYAVVTDLYGNEYQTKDIISRYEDGILQEVKIKMGSTDRGETH